jgi:hypothetical protein
MVSSLDHAQDPNDSVTHAVDRSNSLASVASGQSLSRRPRARSRPRALTLNSPRRRDKTVGSYEAPDVPFLTAAQMFDVSPAPMLNASVVAEAPDRPPRSPLRLSSSPLVATSTASDPLFGLAATDDGEVETRRRAARTEDEVEVCYLFVYSPRRTLIPMVQRRRRKRGSSVPRDAYRLSFLSSASSPTSLLFTHQHHMHMQTLPDFPSLREARQRLRDSHITSLSGTSTSLYPLSTSTGSSADSLPSPRSISDSFLDMDVTHVDSGEDEPGFDPDNVSYRLHLLLNNSYFLPPAHSKPSSTQLTPILPDNKKAPQKGFFDIFRSKPKSESPVTPVTPKALPSLRTPSDVSISERLWAAPLPFAAPLNTACTHSSTTRVAVVRETLQDLNAAAQQAEREIKALENQQPADPVYDDVIDPTDAVDLPPPSADSPFTVQTSAVAGLGVEQSVGAAELADHLPPPGASTVWSIDPGESWRKALLEEAVSFSLDSKSTQSWRNVPASKPQSPASQTGGMHSSSGCWIRTYVVQVRRWTSAF